MNTADSSNQRATSVDLETLARSAAVRAFMERIACDYREPVSGTVLSFCLAEAAANCFGLFHDDGFTIPLMLYVVAKDVARS